MSDAEQLAPARSPLRRLPGVQIIGTGSYVPDNVVTNEDLARLGCDARRVSEHADLLAALDEVLPGLAGRTAPLLLEVIVEPDPDFNP